MFWAYEATDPGKDLLPLGYYRAYAWLAMRFGLDGAGFWCYKYHDARWPLETTDWSVVYQSDDRVVPSRRWKACRDGQEDFRAMHALRRAAKDARAAGFDADADRAEALLAEALENIIGRQIREIDEITRQTRDYEVDFNAMPAYRERFAQEIMRLNAIIAE